MSRPAERTRFAPSPTGLLHIGGVRTAAFAYFLAKQTGGQFIVRVEDTDQQRSVDGGIENIVRTLLALGLTPDEGVTLDANGRIVQVGEYGPYIQSERLDLYQSYAKQLVEAGQAYPCFCSKERLESVRQEQVARKEQPKYDRHCAQLDATTRKARVEQGDAHVIRLRVPDGSTTWTDVIRGDVRFDHATMDDQVLLKSDGFPTYHLAVVVDDHLMNITTVIRGEEWLSSTPKHLILYAFFGWTPPQFAHVPLLLNADRSKLSKRQGDVSAESYLSKGYLPEALLNFVGTLGYNPTGDREVYSVQELIDLFDLTKVKSSGAIVNFEKLDWLNHSYMQQLPVEELVEKLRLSANERPERLVQIVEVERHRAATLNELRDSLRSYTQVPEYSHTLLVWKKSDAREALTMLTEVGEALDAFSWGSVSDIEASVKRWIESHGYQNGPVLWPLRTALSGQAVSPSPFELMYALGIQESRRRLEHAIERLQTPT